MSIAITASTSVVFGPSSYTVDGGSSTPFDYSTFCQITNANTGSQTITVSFQSGIIITTPAFYLETMSSNITFDGLGNAITVNTVTFGLFKSKDKTNIFIQNLGTIGTGSPSQYSSIFIQQSCNNITINKCYNTCQCGGGGQNNGDTAAFANRNTSNITMTNCYNAGPIGNYGAAGIDSGGTNNIITNCYSVGTCDSQGAGICNIATNVTITNCYALYGKIFVSGPGSINKCYQANGTWVDSSANAALTGTPSNTYSPGTTWTSIGNNNPYLLTSFNTLQTYTSNTATISYTQGSTYTSASGTFGSPYTYTIQNVNNANPTNVATVNSSTGVLTYSNLNYSNPIVKIANVLTTLGITNAYYGYNFGTFSLTLTSLSNSQIYANNSIVISNTTYTVDGGSAQTLGAFPIAINQNTGKTGVLSVQFSSGITYTNVNNYFIVATPNITFDGKGNTININVQIYNGLIQNGTSSNNGQNNIIVQNIGITTSGSGGTTGNLPNYQGAIAQQYFANNASNNIIQNCFSTIGFYGGSATDAGLICGRNAGNGGSGSTMLQIKNCYSTSQIINANSQGGICGKNANAIISQCYNTASGNSLGNSGAICADSSSTNLSISNCYCLSGQLTGPISITPTNCYNAQGASWSNTAANAALIYVPQNDGYQQGRAWTTPNPSSTTTPYLLTSFNKYIQPIYIPNSQTIYSTQGLTYTLPSNYVNSRYTSGYQFSLIGVNDVAPSNVSINTTTGILSYTNLEYSNPNDYSSVVVTYQGSGNSYFGYTISNFDLFTYPTPSPISANNSIVITSTTYSVDGGIPQTLPTFPISIINNNPSAQTLTVSFSGPITYTSLDNYFVCGSDNIIFDGKNNLINVNVSKYQGLIMNYPGKNNITVQNIGVNGVSLENNAGYICGMSFGHSSSGCLIQNCYSTGAITGGGGGICGSNTGQFGNVTITNCYSTGAISEAQGIGGGGGICGISTGRDGNVTITNCYSTGAISGGGGGICGQVSDVNFHGLLTITNCYSTGAISDGGGGICGIDAALENGIVTITNCYSTGAITGGGGGICGQNSNYSGQIYGNVTITNCYSTGAITTAGGICGESAGNNGILTITNCYSTGAISGSGGGICDIGAGQNNGIVTITNCYCFFGTISGTNSIVTQTHCYEANNTWSDSDGNALLTGTPSQPLTVGSTWTSVEAGTPYLLSGFNTVQIYDPNVISIPYDYGSSFTTGRGAFTGKYTYYLLNVSNPPPNSSTTINQTNGQITFTNYYLSQPQNRSYTVTMFTSLIVGDPVYYGYYFSTFVLNILYIPEPISLICFPVDTPIKTDRGYVPIQKIDPLKHSINYKKIVAITKTVSTDDYLICFEKNSLKYNVPNERTIMSKDHQILFNDKLTPAEEFLNRITNKKSKLSETSNIYKVKYDGKPLYNVLMEEYDTMTVNNMVCETLHPNNIIARLYNSNLGLEFKQNMIIQMNKSIDNENQESYEQAAIKLHTVSFLKRRLYKKT
jgi:hypothetical protein